MKFIGYILQCFRKYFSIKGCASKAETVTFICFFGIAVLLSAWLLHPGNYGYGFFIFSLIVTFLVPPLFSVLVRRIHDTGNSGWIALSSMFRFFAGKPSSAEDNIYETEKEPALQSLLVIIWLALSGFILYLGYDSLPDYDYAFKAKVNGKTEKVTSFGIWNDKPVYEIFSTKVTRLGGETIFDGEKYIEHVYDWYISPDEKDEPFSCLRKIEYVDFTDNGKEISALVTVNDKEKILWYGSERIENVYSFVAKSKSGNSLFYTTTDEKDNFYLNITSPDSHKRYRIFNHVDFWKYTDDLSHIAYAVDDKKKDRWTLFIDGKQVDSGRLKDGKIDFYGFGMTDDGKKFAYYTFDDDNTYYQKRKYCISTEKRSVFLMIFFLSLKKNIIMMMFTRIFTPCA